jgi:hypothetical protein
VDKDGNLKNEIRVELDKFDSIMIEESMEKVISRKAESAMEEGGEHHNIICVGCWDVFPGGRTTLQYCAVREKVIRNELVDIIISHDGWLEKVWMRWGEGSQ